MDDPQNDRKWPSAEELVLVPRNEKLVLNIN